MQSSFEGSPVHLAKELGCRWRVEQSGGESRAPEVADRAGSHHGSSLFSVLRLGSPHYQPTCFILLHKVEASPEPSRLECRFNRSHHVVNRKAPCAKTRRGFLTSPLVWCPPWTNCFSFGGLSFLGCTRGMTNSSPFNPWLLAQSLALSEQLVFMEEMNGHHITGSREDSESLRRNQYKFPQGAQRLLKDDRGAPQRKS